MQWQKGDYLLTDEPGRLDLAAATAMLRATYWAADRSTEVMERAVQNSMTFSLFHGTKQVGFARVVTDRATVGYLCDVVIADDQRGHGLGKWLLTCILEHPDLRGCRIDLFTRDAQEFYRAFGFGPHRYTNMVRYPK
ncbi:MAG: N-acetyltransferase [Mycobacteriaceae bacterium]|nr:N-acetyltransferase [Mycobacteriaceae bacterium]NBQ42966.1 N-acetyltransferase [Mycobacteriaceae bacterium]NDA68959.1 N-acetyltransferase [Verrucomicrobiota bacterium]NDF00928.1 N-acetyltransferase [Verrucomicrobiota bacterium]